MKVKVITADLPINATAKFMIAKPEYWDKMTVIEKKEYFFSKMQTPQLCKSCGYVVDSDLFVQDVQDIQFNEDEIQPRE